MKLNRSICSKQFIYDGIVHMCNIFHHSKSQTRYIYTCVPRFRSKSLCDRNYIHLFKRSSFCESLSRSSEHDPVKDHNRLLQDQPSKHSVGISSIDFLSDGVVCIQAKVVCHINLHIAFALDKCISENLQVWFCQW